MKKSKGTRKKATRTKGTKRKVSSTKSKISKAKSRKRKETGKRTTETPRKSKAKPSRFGTVAGQEEARQKIKDRLDETALYLEGEGIEARVYVHAYQAGQVDGELSIMIPRGVSSEEVGKKLENAFGHDPGGLGRGFWFSIGARASIKEDETVYRRFKGMNEIGMYYRQVKSAKLIDNFLSLHSFRVSKKTGKRHTPLVEAIGEKYRRKVQMIFIRLNWNPDNEQPKR